MGVDKLIRKVFLTTFSGILLLFALMLGALCLAFPSTMMEITYNLGMESASIHFAERAYDVFDDIHYIACATEISVEEHKNGKIVSCGEQFIADDGFKAYCEAKGGAYEQFIYGRVCLSKYEKGDKANAITLAFESLDGKFPENNAVAAVLLSAMRANDKETVWTIKEKLNTVNGVSEGDKGYLDDTLNVIAQWENEQ